MFVERSRGLSKDIKDLVNPDEDEDFIGICAKETCLKTPCVGEETFRFP